jgi:GNAT superfamily N-acetyltransferase
VIAHAFDVRRATLADLDALARHRVAMFRDMNCVDPSLETELLDASTTHIRAAMKAGEYVGFVAHPAGKPHVVVGGGGVQLRRLLPRPDEGGQRVLTGREAVILNMYVERDVRRRGVARRLMEAMLEWVAETDVVRLVLHASDEGRPLYESMGFAPTNEMRRVGALR